MKLFGMRTVTINGNVIYIIKVRVKSNDNNVMALEPLKTINGLTLDPVISKHGNMIEINYFGTSYAICNEVFRLVGSALKQVQINNINAKYAWTEPYYEEIVAS
jgi:hypothetical protein